MYMIYAEARCTIGTFAAQFNPFEYNFCLDFQLSGFLIILRSVNILPFTNKHTSGY